MGATTGHCLCGAVAWRGVGPGMHAHVCHCSTCNRWAGGPFIGVRFDGGVEIDTPESVSWYSSSDWAERGACRTCGGALFYRLKADPAGLIATAGSMDDASAVHIGEHIFIDEKPAYYDFTGDAPRVTGADVFARFASPGDRE